MTTMNVFTYGSLMYPEIWDRVVGGHYASCQAVLCGFRRYQVMGEEFPGITAGNGEVSGILYFNVTPDDLKILDHFEGEYYRRETGLVNLSGGIPLPAAFYTFNEDYLHLLQANDWDPERFAAHGIRRFIADWMTPRLTTVP